MEAKVKRFAVAALMLIVGAIGVAAQGPTPVSTLNSFYKYNNADLEAFDRTALNARKRWLSKSLFDLINAYFDSEDEALRRDKSAKRRFADGSPFSPIDECYRMGTFYPDTIRTRKLQSASKTATYEVKFFLAKACAADPSETFKVKLVRNGKVWLIDDVVYPDGSTLAGGLK